MLLTSLLTIFLCLRTLLANETTPDCPIFPPLANGIVKIIRNEYGEIATISCNDGYDLEGTSDVYCTNGEWERFSQPQCNKRCLAPYYLKNGALEIEGEKDENGLFHKGALATYSCAEGYYLSPTESKYRVCEKGIWTGPRAACLPNEKITSCAPPKDLINGYFVPEKNDIYDGYNIGQRLHYSCKSGYVLNGSSVQQCLDDGTWSPKIAPFCTPETTDTTYGQSFESD